MTIQVGPFEEVNLKRSRFLPGLQFTSRILAARWSYIRIAELFPV